MNEVESQEKKPFDPSTSTLLTSSSEPEVKEEVRETWKNSKETFLSALGAVIGLGNIWRFPYITFQYGGGAFLIPYLIFVICLGYPMFFLETSLGQFTRCGAMEAWNIVSLFKGVGLGAGVITFFSSVYYITVMAWALNYFFHTFRITDLPWMQCGQWWNTENCRTYQEAIKLNVTGLSGKSNISLPIVEFWNNFVLRKTENGIDEIGSIDNWQMVLCMLASWLIIYFCIYKGTKSTGKVIYFTSLFPFVILIILLVRGCTLPGASKGIEFYLKPNISQLARAEVWVAAGSQVCYSYAICFAVLVAYGSFSDFKSNCLTRTLYLSVCCSMTSFIGGFAVFAVLGNMAQVMNVEDVQDVVKSGPGLAFITYPTALSMMPLPQFWNMLFFLMLLLLAVDSQFCCLEGGLTLVYDRCEWPRKNRELFVGIVCGALFVFGLLFVTPGGVYIFEIFNNYAVGGIALLWLVLWQSVGIGWGVGIDRYYDCINEMIGYYPNKYMSFCFRYATPALTSGVFLFYTIDYKPLIIGGYVYPPWANALGWMLTMSSFLCVPAWAIYELYMADGLYIVESFKNALKPKIPLPEKEKLNMEELMCVKHEEKI